MKIKHSELLKRRVVHPITGQVYVISNIAKDGTVKLDEASSINIDQIVKGWQFLDSNVQTESLICG